MATMQTWQAAAAFFSAQLLAASLLQVPNHQASKTCLHLGCGHVEPGGIPRATNATNPAGGWSVEQREMLWGGQDFFLLAPVRRWDEWQGAALQLQGLVDAATSGEAGTGSWCFINRVIVVSGAKVPGTVVPVCGQA